MRQLFLEGLEDRRLMAFNVLAEYPTGLAPTDVALADVNGDGRPDMIVANSGGSSIDIRLGNADGTFGAAINSETGASPHSVAVGDFTSDGVADLVTANNNDLSLLIGNGDGSFHQPVAISLPGKLLSEFPAAGVQPQTLQSVAAGDLNADGKLDLAVAASANYLYCPYYCYPKYDGFVNVLLGNGSGGFSTPEVHRLGAQRSPAAIAIGDLNGDGNADVLTANSSDHSSDLSALLGDGTGGFGNSIHSGLGNFLSSISLGDLDGDGNLDTVIRAGSGLIVQTGQGNGTFVSAPAVFLGHSVGSVVMGDVNADGKLDLVASGSTFNCTSYGYYGCYDGFYARQATVLLGIGQGDFLQPLTSSLGPGGGHLPDLDLADLTGDGLPELVTIDYYGNTAIVAINGGDVNAPPSIAVLDATVTEGDNGTVNAVFTVSIIGNHDGVSVDYSTADSTAVAGADYMATAGTLTFVPGQTSQTISVPVFGDTLDEHDEQFFVNLSNAAGGQITDSQGLGTILDVDGPPLVTISDVTENEGHENTTSFVFVVSLSEASGKWVSMDFTTSDGTATSFDNDYVGTSGTVDISPGQTSATITILVPGDEKKELNETFSVYLTGAINGTISDYQGVGTILNDDGATSPPRISIGDASVVEGNSGTTLTTFTVSLSNASGEGVWVNYQTKNATAKTSDKDYVATSGTVYFAPGETTKTITVSIIGDTKKERDERFYVNLSSASGGEIADNQGVGTIWNDDGGGKKASRSSASSIDAAIDDFMTSQRKKRRR